MSADLQPALLRCENVEPFTGNVFGKLMLVARYLLYPFGLKNRKNTHFEKCFSAGKKRPVCRTKRGVFLTKLNYRSAGTRIPVAIGVLLVADNHLFRVDKLVVDHKGIGVYTCR